MSATRRRFGAGAVNARSTRSGRRPGPVPRTVVRGVSTRDTLRRPAAFISLCTVHCALCSVYRATGRPATPPSRPSGAHTFRMPYTPQLFRCTRSISQVVSVSVTDRRDGGRADRLDPEQVLVSVDAVDDYREGLPSSANRAAVSVEVPVREPASISARLTQPRNVSGLIPSCSPIRRHTRSCRRCPARTSHRARAGSCAPAARRGTSVAPPSFLAPPGLMVSIKPGARQTAS